MIPNRNAPAAGMMFPGHAAGGKMAARTAWIDAATNVMPIGYVISQPAEAGFGT